MTPVEVLASHITCSCGEWAENLEENAEHLLDELDKAGYRVITKDAL